MAEVFYFHVQEDRSIKYKLPEPIMQEDKDVAVWRFRIPKILNEIDMSAWSWWFVYVNAKGQTFSELLTLTDDIDEPSSYSTADYDIDYGISKFPGSFSFALEAISTEQGGEIDGEWHTRTYSHKVDKTLQGNQAEYAETESDIISALMQEVRNKVNQLVGGATPLPVNLKSLMTDHDKVYLYTGSEDGEQTGYWYYWNGTNFVPGGLYGVGVQIDPTLSQSGQATDAAVVGEKFTDLKSAFDNLKNDKIITNVPANWAQNRVMLSGGVLTEVASTVFANSGIIETTEDLTIEVAQGYTIFGWATAYNELGHGGRAIVNAWSSEKITYTYDSTYPYLVLCLQKSPSAVITATEAANAVKIYSENETIFALKTTVAEIYSAVDELDVEVDNLKNGVELSTVNLPLTFQSGRVTVSNSTVTVATNSSYAYMKYAELQYGTEYTMHVPSGLDVFGYIINQNNDTYTRLDSFASAWVSGESEIKHTPLTEMQYYYLVLSVKKTAGGAITPEEASGIAVTYEATEDVKIVEELKLDINKAAFCPIATGAQIVYNADTSASSNFIVNALSYDDGTIIACRSNGKVVRIGYDGTETELLSLSGSGFDWRLCWMDSNENVYVSPHASWGSMTMIDRGLYRLAKGQNSFTKVIALYDPSSSVPTEKESNDDTIWTMCEDSDGNLYAGVYAHTTHANPAIYKSTDGGNTWAYLINFNDARYTLGGRHVHTVVFSEWKNALYCIIGEINTIFKSTDGGTNWKNLNVTLRTKGSALLATRNGLLIGSDGAYNCEIDLLYNDDVTHKTVFSGWANTVFGIRQSDLTGFIYAFTKIDSSVANDQYMPSYGVLYGTKTLEAWKNGDYTGGTPPTHLAEWEEYNASVASKYPDDAIRPQHFAILVSRDGGLRWEVLKAIPCDSRAAYGIWTIGQFHNGECLCGVYTGNYVGSTFVTGVANPLVISEGKHKYVSNGCDLDGEIFVRTNSSSTVTVVN